MEAFKITFLLFLCILVQVSAAGFEGCRIRYGRRGCYDKIHEGVLVTCDGNDEVKEIPESIPADTVYISFVNFQFKKLKRSNFTQLRSVECMSIMDSGINSIDYDTFADMQHLHELEIKNTYVKDNDLHFINHPDFTANLISLSSSQGVTGLHFNGTMSLQKLKVLALDDNNIDFIEPSIIPQLITMEKLSLSNNNLKTLDWQKLNALQNLNNLNLDGNRFQTIPENVFNLFYAVKELTLANNPLHCSCKLRWLKEFYDSTTDKLLDYNSIECVSPFQRRMIDTFEEDFVCSKPSTPKIEWIKVDDNEYVVNCSSVGDPAPTLTMTFPDYRKLVTPPHEDLSILTTMSPRILSNVGRFVCEATNTEGTIVSIEEIPAPASAGLAQGSVVLVLSTICTWLLASS